MKAVVLFVFLAEKIFVNKSKRDINFKRKKEKMRRRFAEKRPSILYGIPTTISFLHAQIYTYIYMYIILAVVLKNCMEFLLQNEISCHFPEKIRFPKL